MTYMLPYNKLPQDWATEKNNQARSSSHFGALETAWVGGLRLREARKSLVGTPFRAAGLTMRGR